MITLSKVTFIGSGPYDSTYLSVDAMEALRQADCVLYDHLLDEECLHLTKGECIYVGKKAGAHSMKQEDINALLVEKTSQYENVVRLKGGDSFIFGRGGEEAMALYEHQIPFTFIPGISSVIAATEMAGIPLTYRGISSGFQVLSAHLKDHKLGIASRHIRNADITQVILMGLSRVSQICEIFLKAGRDAKTPMAIISNGASPKQKVLCATISDMPEKLAASPMSSPAIIVIGEVVSLREQLNFYEKQPLFGKRILVTKVKQEPSPLTGLLKKNGADVTELCLGEIHPYSIEIEESIFQKTMTFVFSSRHGIHAFFQTYLKTYDIRKLSHCRFITIGEKTAQAMLQYGIHVDNHAQGSHEKLIQLLHDEQKLNTTIIYCKGKEAGSLIVEGKKISEWIVYENRAVPANRSLIYDAICFTCASSVERYPDLPIDQLCVSIGPTTTEALRKRNIQNIIEAKTPSYEAMVDALCRKGSFTCTEEED